MIKPSVSRRAFTAFTAATAAVSMTTRKPAVAETAMMTRPIPSSGEPLPVIGLGTSSSFIVDRADTAGMEQRKAVRCAAAVAEQTSLLF